MNEMVSRVARQEKGVDADTAGRRFVLVASEKPDPAGTEYTFLTCAGCAPSGIHGWAIRRH